MDTKDFLKLAFSYANNDEFSSALSICDYVIKQDPKNDEPYYIRGYIKHLSRNYLSAISDLSTAINIHPHEDAYRIRGICKENLGFIEWAIDDYDKGLKQNPNDLKILICKASIFESEGEWEKAIPLYLKVVKTNENLDEIYYKISQLYLRLSKYELAIRAIKNAYKIKQLEQYKDYIQEIIIKSGYDPINIFSNFFDGVIITEN